MCGILGIYNLKESKPFENERFENALLTMNYRGPDTNSIKEVDEKVILGHLRLSIIDLDKESNQPFAVDNTHWVVFNGEIYNFIELRKELMRAGYTFRTKGDTEVLLRSYEHWGADCVNHFNGMWAFAIYNKLQNILFCSRDRFGIKPFNYAVKNGQFIFSSEIKAILEYFPEERVPNYNVISNYCRQGIGAQTTKTWFKNISRLEPAHNLIISNHGIRKERYWDYPRKINYHLPFKQAKKEYFEILKNAVEIRMRSDVPVGFTLSSGIDSTSIVSLLKNKFKGNNRTYTASFEGSDFGKKENENFRQDIETDESALVEKLASDLDLDPDIIKVSYENYIRDLHRIIRNLESGHRSPAIFPLYKILQKATNDVTVIIEGQGADELLGGYISNVAPVFILELFCHFKFIRAFKELRAFSKLYSLKSAFMLLIRQSDFDVVKRWYYKFSGIDNLFQGDLKKYSLLKDYPIKPRGFKNRLTRHLFKAHTGGLVNLLHYGDAISMSNSLESRLPFMDYRLVEYVFTLPSKFKIHNGMGKYIHREAMKGVVPDYILHNRLKFGFDSPLSHIFMKTGEGSAMSILLSEKCLQRGLFSKDALERSFKIHQTGVKNESRILYRMLCVEIWFRNFIDIIA